MARDKGTPAWLIERLALGELDADTAAAVRKRLAEEGRSADDVLAALAADDREIFQAHPPAAVAAAVARRASQARRGRGAWLFGGSLAAAGAVAAALLLVQVRPGNPPGGGGARETAEETRIKGTATAAGPRLLVYRHGRDGDQRLGDGATARRGDLVQLAYAVGTPVWGVLLSVDGRGQITQHWPAPGVGAAVPLRAAREVRLPAAYELDDAPAFERFFLIAADQPFPIDPVLAAARALAARPDAARVQALPLPARFQQVSLALEKPRKETR